MASSSASHSRGRGTHTVKGGETLAGIAHSHGLDWHTLARANHITDPSRLRIGSVLHIPARSGHGHGHAHGSQHAPGHAPSPTRTPTPSTPPTLPAAPAGPIARPQGGARLGDLSMRYETGFYPGQELQAAAVVSSGVNDPGGVSYGAYQLASSASGGHQVQAFLRHEGMPWATQFASADPTVRNGPFGTTWKTIAAAQPDAFFLAQHVYIERTHYTPVVNYVLTAAGLDIGQRSRPVQNAVWSMSVQHGKAPMLVARAVQNAGPQGTLSDADYDRKLVNALYDVRDDYVDAIGLGYLKARYVSERRDALQQLGTQ